MKIITIIFLPWFLVACGPAYSPYRTVSYQQPIKTGETAYFYPSESCIESEYDSRDLTWRIANVANSNSQAGYISTAAELLGYAMDYANSRNHRGCR